MFGLLAAWLLVAVVEGEASKPRRRNSPLDRLKRRSATARWDELRQAWLPQGPTEGPTPPSDAPGQVATDGSLPISARKHQQWAPPVTSEAGGSASATGLDPFGPALPDPRSGAGSPPWITAGPAGVQVQGMPPLPAPESPQELVATKPAAESPQRVSQVPYQQPRVPGGANGLPRTAAARDVLPKPITEILPYYDYSPEGEDPCEFLCPRPEGCPPDTQAKPCPKMVKLPDVTAEGRAFLGTHVLWEPSNLFHNPLYFEDHSLERYGHTHNPLLQPLVSVGKFGVQLIGMPYQLALHPPCEEMYTLGWHRPGECVPYRYHFPPWNTKAAITAGAAYTGLIFLIP